MTSNLVFDATDGTIYADSDDDLGTYELSLMVNGFVSTATNGSTVFRLGVGRADDPTWSLVNYTVNQQLNGVTAANTIVDFSGNSRFTISATGKANGVYIAAWFDWSGLSTTGTFSIRNGTLAIRRQA